MECSPVDDSAVIAEVRAREWTPGSWRGLECHQMATYDDAAAYGAVMSKLSKLPPLVQPAEVARLTELLAQAGRGERFIIQGGDCAERFIDCEPERLEAQLTLLAQMGAIIERVANVPTVRVARIAGQYGKPRSKPTETVDGFGEIYSFKGDNINGYDPKDRAWDPKRLLDGYWHSAATLNYLRSLREQEDYSQFTAERLDIDKLKSSQHFKTWSSVATGIKESPPDLKSSRHFKTWSSVATGIRDSSPDLSGDAFFTAHEAMQLDLEQALTREVQGKGYYNLSAHMVWIGDRTRQILGSHVEYFRGIRNPIGCKVGPSMSPAELRQLVQILNPDKIEGRLVLITRYGHGKVESTLPEHIKAVQDSGVPVVWQADGVHGNTVTAINKLKTRKFDDVVGECVKAMRIHREHGSILAGIHLEMTGGATVTECTGGCANIFEEMLTQNYETYCDPRLNYSQAIEAAFTVAGALSAK